MKFTDGNWLVKDGFDLIPGDQLFTTDHDSHSLTAYVAPRSVSERGGQLDVPLLTVTYTSPIEDVIRVQITRHKGRKKSGACFYNP